jgi:hypothetical protein
MIAKKKGFHFIPYKRELISPTFRFYILSLSFSLTLTLTLTLSLVGGTMLTEDHSDTL